MSRSFHPGSNRENRYLTDALTAAADARFMVENLPACGLIPLL
jgi:hypothetical protein